MQVEARCIESGHGAGDSVSAQDVARLYGVLLKMPLDHHLGSGASDLSGETEGSHLKPDVSRYADHSWFIANTGQSRQDSHSGTAALVV